MSVKISQTTDNAEQVKQCMKMMNEQCMNVATKARGYALAAAAYPGHVARIADLEKQLDDARRELWEYREGVTGYLAALGQLQNLAKKPEPARPFQQHRW